MAASLIGWIWSYPDLASTDRYVLLALNERVRWHDLRGRWELNVSYSYVAKMCGIDRSTVVRAIKRLTCSGVITIEKSFDATGRQHENNFVVNAPSLVRKDTPVRPANSEGGKLQPPSGNAPPQGGKKPQPEPITAKPAPLQAAQNVGDAKRNPPVAKRNPQSESSPEGENAQKLNDSAKGGVANCTGGGGNLPPNSLKQSTNQLINPAGESFPMRADWRPSEHFTERLTMFGIPPGTLDQNLLGEFRSYWMARPNDWHAQSMWEHKLAGKIKHDMAAKARVANGSANQPSQGFIQKHTDTSWREGL